MNASARLAAAAFVVAVVGGGLLYLLGPAPGPGGPPAATATPVPATLVPATPSPSPAISYDPATWLPFTSPEYGYSMAYPPSWTHAPATQAWAGETFDEMWASAANAPWVDKFYIGVTMTAVAIPFAEGTAQGPWIDAYMAPPPGATPTCVVHAADMSPIVIDGQAGSISTSCEDSRAAFVVKGGHIYVFAISTPSDPALFDAFLSTVRLPKA